MQSNVQDAEQLFTIDNSEFGVNVGAGAMGFATDHVGFRGDVRYYRQLTDPTRTTTSTSISAASISGGARVGLTFRW